MFYNYFKPNNKGGIIYKPEEEELHEGEKLKKIRSRVFIIKKANTNF